MKIFQARGARSGNDWQELSKTEPPEGVIVNTKVEDENGLRKEVDLKRHGQFWHLPDSSMYVYYTPTHWRFR